MTEHEALKNFIEQIRWLQEPEFGDFKRKVGLYIQRLLESTPALQRGAAGKAISEIKMEVIYNPNGDMESTRRRVLEIAEKVLGSGLH